jgi:ABC-type phosphate transport system substrate-binding protein
VAIDQITPSEERLEGGTYTPSRTIILAIGKNASKRAKDFYEYCLSDEAKSLAKSIGFIPVK